MNWERLAYYSTIAATALIGLFVACMLLIAVISASFRYILLSVIEGGFYGYPCFPERHRRFFAAAIAYSLKESEFLKTNFGFITANVGRGFFIGL